MIAPMLVVQIAGLAMVAVGLFAARMPAEDRGGLLVFGGLVAIMAALCLYGLAEKYEHSPSCRLSPASVVEGIAP